MVMPTEQHHETKLSKKDRKVEAMEIEADGLPRIRYVERFAKYQLPRIEESWSIVGRALRKHGISCSVYYDRGYFRIRTTRLTRDPDIIERAREFIILIAKTEVPPSRCVQILNGDPHHEYINIGFQEDGLCKIHGIKKVDTAFFFANVLFSKDQYDKQLKSLHRNKKELGRILDCEFYVNENSVTAVSGSLRSVNTAKSLVGRCFVEKVDAADLVKMMNKKYRQAAGKALECLRIWLVTMNTSYYC